MTEVDSTAVKASSLPMGLSGQDPQEWAEWVVSCEKSGTSTGAEVRNLFRFQLGRSDGVAPERLPRLVRTSAPRKGRTSVRVPEGDRRDYVTACEATGTSVSEEVRGLVRWQLGRVGAPRPRRLAEEVVVFPVAEVRRWLSALGAGGARNADEVVGAMRAALKDGGW